MRASQCASSRCRTRAPRGGSRWLFRIALIAAAAIPAAPALGQAGAARPAASSGAPSGQRSERALEAVLIASLRAAERTNGRDHAETLILVNSLARLYRRQSRYDEAEPLYLRVLETRERILGREHRDTLVSVNSLARLYQRQGRYDEAELLLVRARRAGADLGQSDQRAREEDLVARLRVAERANGRDHSGTLSLVDRLASLYQGNQRDAEAEPLLLRALEARQRVLGSGHPDTLAAIDTLAEFYQTRQRRADLEPLLLRALESSRAVLEARERRLGRDHPETLLSAYDLADRYLARNRPADAEPLLVRVLRARESALGREHPDTLISAARLGEFYRSQSRLTEAEPLLVRVLEARQRLLGADHNDTLSSADNLGQLYHSQGRDDEAEPLQDRVTAQAEGRSEFLFRRAQEVDLAERLRFAERTKGPDDPETIGSASDLAVFYRDFVMKSADARRLFVRVLEARERLLGRDHPDTLAAVNNLLVLYERRQRDADVAPLRARLEEALAAKVRELEARERTLGRDHPDTLGAVYNLAGLYATRSGAFATLDDNAAAERLFLRALEGRERVLGPDHPDTLVSVMGLADFYARLHGHGADAEALYRRALEARERVLGPDHPDTLASLNSLASHFTGDRARAAPLYVRALERNERVLGREHPTTIGAANYLAELYVGLGRYAEAVPLYLRVLAAREGAFGRDHPDALDIVNKLADLYLRQHGYAEAEPLLVRALERNERVLGRRHLDTLLSVNSLARLYHSQGRYAEAEPLLLGALEARLGPREARERAEREALDGGERGGIEIGGDQDDEYYYTALISNSLGELYVSLGRYAEAEPLFLRAQGGSEGGGPLMDSAGLYLRNLSNLYRRQGRYIEAEPMLAYFARMPDTEHPDTLTAVNTLAALYQDQHRYAEAEPLYVRALEARERVLGREHPDTAASAAGLASLRLSAPASAASAIGPARLAVSSLRTRRAGSVDSALARAQRGREQFQSGQMFLLLPSAAWAVAQGDEQQKPALTGEAFTALQDATAGTTDQAVAKMAAQRLADQAGAGLGSLVRERESLNVQWAVNSETYSAALARSDASAEEMKRRLPAERARIEARMDEIDAMLRRDFPQYFSLVRPEALDAATAQAMLAPDEAILMVVPTEFGTHVMAISRTDIRWVRSDWTTTEVDGAVGQLLGNIHVTMAGGRFSYDRQTAFALYRQVVAPMASLLEGKRHVFIVAAGSLTSLPFGILVTAEPEGADSDPEALRATRWFADAHALVQIPSIQSLQFLRLYRQSTGPGDRSAGGFIGFGNPLLEGPTDPEARRLCARGRGTAGTTPGMIVTPGRTRSGAMLANVAAIRHLCPLTGTASELEQMRTAFEAPPAALFLEANATEPRLRQMDLSQVRILAFATHGLLGGEVGDVAEPGLVLTPPVIASEDDDGYLTASEVSALRLDADWVILSACNTAAGSGAPGAPGLSGLARAFFYAGARNLLASHWLVADDAAPRLTVRAIQLMRQNPGLSRAEALQRSMREVREDGDSRHRAWAHPGVWGVFSLVGDGAR